MDLMTGGPAGYDICWIYKQKGGIEKVKLVMITQIPARVLACLGTVISPKQPEHETSLCRDNFHWRRIRLVQDI